MQVCVIQTLLTPAIRFVVGLGSNPLSQLVELFVHARQDDDTGLDLPAEDDAFTFVANELNLSQHRSVLECDGDVLAGGDVA